MLIPIGHDSGTVRRNPWVTYALMALCLGAFLYTNSTHHEIARRYADELKTSVEYFVEHPYLVPPDDLEPFLGEDWEEQRELLIEMRRQAGELVLPDFILAEQQEELDARVASATRVKESHPFFRWGLVASAPTFVGAFGYMFIHGGWMHLLGNMLLLFLTGPFIEDKWGRPVYLAFYLLAGLAGAGLFMSRFPELTTPLVGASGAVAGCMGAFLIRFWNAKLRYLCWLVFFGFTFSAPAWLMMPLWFAGEFLAAHLTEAVNPMGGGGVAYWAHVGGFTFGALTATALRVLKIEERWMDSVVDRKIGAVSNDGVEAAMVALEGGDAESAFAQLQREVRRDPRNREAAQAFWDAAVALGRAAEAAPGFLRLIRSELREGQNELAVQHWMEFTQRGESLTIDPALALRLGPEMAEAGHPSLCGDILRRCLGSPEITPSIALGVARKARELDPAVCVEAARLAVGGSPDEDAAARRLLEELGDPAPPEPGELDPTALDPLDMEMEAAGIDPATELAPPASAASNPESMPQPSPPTAEADPDAMIVEPTTVAAADPESAATPTALERSGGLGSLEAPVDELAGVDLDDLDLDGLDLDALGLDVAGAEADTGSLAPGGSTDLTSDTASLPPPVPEIAEPSATSGPAAGSEPRMFDPAALAQDAAPVTEGGPDEWGNVSLDEGRSAAAERGPEMGAPPVRSAPAPALRPLKVMTAVPLRLRDDSLSLDVDGRGKTRLRFDRIDALAAAAVRVEGRERPVLLVDLVLNLGEDRERPLQVVRLRSDRFDPRKLVDGAARPLDALRRFVERLLGETAATPLPDRDAVQGRPRFPAYDGLAAYEADLLFAEREPTP